MHNGPGRLEQLTPGCKTLPLELCWAIIDFVAAFTDDRDSSLAACVLVCHAWLPYARAHLFHTVALRTFQEYDRFVEALQLSPSLASLVRVLHFKIRGIVTDPSHQGRTPPVSLFAQLPLLESISYYSWLSAQTQQLRSEIAGLPHVASVTSFTINVCVFRRFSDLVLLLGVFPNLRKLWLFDVIFLDHDVPGPGLDQQRRLPLKSLYLISLRETTPVLQWLINASSIASLRRVSAGMTDETSQATLSRFLRACGSSLRHLSLLPRPTHLVGSVRGDTLIVFAYRFIAQ